MMKSYLFLFYLLFFADSIYSQVIVKAEPPGAQPFFDEFILESFESTDVDKKHDLSGWIALEFSVSESGQLDSFEVVKTEGQKDTIPAEPAGGMDMLRSYMAKKFDVPVQAMGKRINGTMYVQFVVSETGKLTDFEVQNDLGYGTGRALINVIRKGPKWIPAYFDGKAVSSVQKIPMRLRLQ